MKLINKAWAAITNKEKYSPSEHQGEAELPTVMITKCKMCGGDITFSPNSTYSTCDYCGSVSTVPHLNNENELNIFNRANHYRSQGEFDKALAAYEKLLEYDNTNAEAHWGAALSRYGIEYVEDPVTKKRVPTCHRVNYKSILADDDCLAAIKYAPDKDSKKIYKEQASLIAEIQKGILAISANEKPYDVFICYKDKDDNGERTRDSQWAQDIYYSLIDQGFKVFFSRITLEDKLGEEYEPYIFAALNSAKVMLVIGSKPEFFVAPWVRNEWSRYLSFMAKDGTRSLIPCYRDMDPYDLPEELSMLQSLDMGKIGFIQDLIHGIKKLINSSESPVAGNIAQENQIKDNYNPSVQHEIELVNNIMQRELQEYDRSRQQIELEIENKRSEFTNKNKFLRKKSQDEFDAAMAELQNKLNAIKARAESTKIKYLLIRGNPDERKKWVDSFLQREKRYQEALLLFEKKEYLKARDEFRKLYGLYDSATKAEECEKAYRYECYIEAIELQKQKKWAEARDAFNALEGYLDSRNREEQCKKECLSESYKQAIILQNNKDWTAAYCAFDELGNYLDSANRKQKCKEQIDAIRDEETIRLRAIKEAENREYERLNKSQKYKPKKKKTGCIVRLARLIGLTCAASLIVTIIMFISGEFNFYKVKKNRTDIAPTDSVYISEGENIDNIDSTPIEGAYIDGGQYGDINWEFQDTGLLIIRGSGNLDSNSGWARHKYEVTFVQIEPGITGIGDSVFRSCSRLSGITIPDTVKMIGSNAFCYCSSLNGITIPGSVKTIGERAFANSGISTCILGDGIEEIASYAFYDTTKLKSIRIPGSVKIIGERAFSYSGLITCIFDDGITEITKYAFYNAGDLKELTLPSSLIVIGERAFTYCSLEEVVIPRSVKQIGAAAFRQSDNIRKVYYGGSRDEWEALETANSGLEKAEKVFNYER